MTDAELIYRLSKENEELKDRIDADIEIGNEIINRLIAVGAPLNDNLLRFNKEQISYLRPILDLAKELRREDWDI